MWPVWSPLTSWFCSSCTVPSPLTDRTLRASSRTRFGQEFLQIESWERYLLIMLMYVCAIFVPCYWHIGKQIGGLQLFTCFVFIFNLNVFTGSQRKLWTPEKNFQYAHEVSSPPVETDWGYFLQVCFVSFLDRVISTVYEGVVLPHRYFN